MDPSGAGRMPAREALKIALGERHPVMGTFIQIGDPTIVEVLGRAGFDFGILDLEHGPLQTNSIAPMVRSADRTAFPLIVRLPMEKLAFVSQFLDSGCRGILAAKVGSVADAEQVVRAVRYPPLGDRGACLGTHANDYGWLDWADHVALADRSTVVGIALEGPRAIADADAILSVPGLDFVFVGIFDLAASLGIRPGLDLPEIQEAVRTIAQKAARHGVAAGAWAPTTLMAQRWLELGVTFLPISLDVLMWRSLCISTVEDWRARVESVGAAGA